MPSTLKRMSFREISNCVDRQFDRNKILALLKLAIEQANSNSKRLLFLEGDPGIGKTVLLGDLQQHILKNHQGWRVIGPYDAYDFVNNTPYARFISLMNECAERPLLALTNPDNTTIEDVIQCASKLELEFTNRANEPLIIIFDELEWWLDLEGAERETLDHLFRIVWRVLLRQAAMPCVIICAGRRLPVFRDVLLRRTLETIPIAGFTNDDIQHLIVESINPTFVDYIVRRANGNAWAAQLLEHALQANPEAVSDAVARELLLRQVFNQILAGRIDTDLTEALYSLAQHRPDGFYADDELLPEGDRTIAKLVRTSCISFDPDKSRYFVALVLSSLFNPS